MEKRKTVRFSGMKPFDLTVFLHKDTPVSPRRPPDSHIHNICEIYVHLTGDVSFMVENQVYSVSRGDVIITRPYEYHHCIYHGATTHDHVWITFSHEGNEDLLGAFFDREKGEGNLISLPQYKKEKLLALCEALTEEESAVGQHAAFLSVLDLLSEREGGKNVSSLPEDVQRCVDYIIRHIAEPITVRVLAQYAYVTEATLQRHFKRYVGLSPLAYIKNYRLALAASNLEKGETVTSAALISGFSDYSHFIAAFKKKYGKTPLQYKKGLTES